MSPARLAARYQTRPRAVEAHLEREIIAAVERRRDLTRQARALSNRSLAAKFEVAESTIWTACEQLQRPERANRRLTRDDLQLIVDCIAERERLYAEIATLSDFEIAQRHGIRPATVKYLAESSTLDRRSVVHVR